MCICVSTGEQVSEVCRKDVHLLKNTYSLYALILWKMARITVVLLLRGGLLSISVRIRVHILLDRAKGMQVATGDLFPSY